MSTKYILVDEELQLEILKELKEVKKLLFEKNSPPTHITEKPYDTAEVMAYLNVSRRTVNNYRLRGMKPINNLPGKKFYWKRDVDAFLASNNIPLSFKNNTNAS